MAPGDPLALADVSKNMIVEAQDAAGNWYIAKVKRVCEERGAKVHYAGYECQTHEKRAPGSAARLQEAWPAETVADELEATGHGSTAVCVGPDEYLRRHTSPAVGSRLSPRRRPAGRRSLLHCWRAGLDYNLYAPPSPQPRTAANALVHRRCAHALAADAHALAATHSARVGSVDTVPPPPRSVTYLAAPRGRHRRRHHKPSPLRPPPSPHRPRCRRPRGRRHCHRQTGSGGAGAEPRCPAASRRSRWTRDADGGETRDEPESGVPCGAAGRGVCGCALKRLGAWSAGAARDACLGSGRPATAAADGRRSPRLLVMARR